MKVDNTLYYETDQNRFVIDDIMLKMETSNQISHYQTNMSALIQLGNWFDYLRENNVYNNTRIIIVSDHGAGLFQIENLVFDSAGTTDYFYNDTAECFFPLLMVKDFDQNSCFETSDKFMTNADVPLLATYNLINDPVNPFTYNSIENNNKTEREQWIITSEEWDISVNNGNTFLPSTWFAVKDNIWDKNNWRYIDEECIIPEEALQ